MERFCDVTTMNLAFYDSVLNKPRSAKFKPIVTPSQKWRDFLKNIAMIA